jgi:hypothetical protein
VLLLFASFKGRRASFRHGMILLTRPPTDTDGADDLPVSFQGNAARKDHDAAVIGRMNPEELAARLRLCREVFRGNIERAR